MGAGGSTPAGSKAGSHAGKASAQQSRQAPTSLTAMKKTPVAPLPSHVAIVDFDPLVHKLLASKGVGVVLGPESFGKLAAEMPAPAANAGPNSAGTEYRWFAEDLERVGHWEAYNNESSQRLESAFMARKESCLVTLRKHVYTVNLTTMQQLPPAATAASASTAINSPGSSTAPAAGGTSAGRLRRVKRAPAKVTTHPTTGEEVVEAVHETMMDPFAEDSDVTAATHTADAAGDARQYAAQAANTAFPCLTKVAYPSISPLYALDVSPAASALSAEARSAGLGEAALNGVFVLSGGKDGKLVEWNATTGHIKTRYAITASRPTSVLVARYSPSGRFVVGGCDDNDARLYRVGQSSPVYMLKGHTHKVYGISVMANEMRVVTGSMDAHVRLWDVETGACTHDEQSHTSHIFAVLASPHNDSFCLSAGNDAILCAHDMRCASSVVMRLRGHTSTLWDVAIFPGLGGENVQLASAGMDSTVRLWDPRRPEEAFQVLRNHTKSVHALAYLPNGKGILSSAKDSYVFLADTSTGATMWRAKSQQTGVFRVVYHAELQLMMTSGVSGLVNQWDWPLGAAY